MDEEERKRMEQQMLMGMTSQNATLPEQPAPQPPIAPSASAPAPQAQAPVAEAQAPVAEAQAPVAETQAPVMNIPIAPPIPEGAAGSPQENFRQRMLTGGALTDQELQQANAFAESMGTTFSPTAGYAPIAPPAATPNPEMGPMQFIDKRTGEPLDPEVVKKVQDAGLGQYLSQASFPVPQAPAPQAVAPQAPIAPMGPEETRARLGGMTLNEYLNAPGGTPGVSGMRTDEQGRMKPDEYFGPAPTQGASPAPSPVIPGVTPEGGQGASPAPSGQTPIAQAPSAPLSDFEQESINRQNRMAAGGGAQASQNVPQDVRTALSTPAGQRTPEQQARIARWSSSTQGQQMGGEAGYKQSIKTDDQKKAEALAIEAQEIANEAARLGITNAQAAELRRQSKEERDVAANERAEELLQIQKDQEARAKRGEQRTIEAGLAAQAHAAKSQEQRDEEIKLKERKLELEIAEANRRNPTEGAKAAEAKKFMDENNLIFQNGVLYEKTGWIKGEMVKVTNPAFMDVPGMEFLRQTSMGPTGNTPVDYSAYDVRAVGTPAPGTPTAVPPASGTSAPPATPPANVTVTPATATNNAVTEQTLNSVAASNTPVRRPGETETSFIQRKMREETARRSAAFQAGLANQ